MNEKESKFSPCIPSSFKIANLLSEVVEPITECPFLINKIANGKPSQPHPTIPILDTNFY